MIRRLLARLYAPRFRENDLLAEMAGVRMHNARLASRNLALESRVRALEAERVEARRQFFESDAALVAARAAHDRLCVDTSRQLANERARRERAERFPNGWAQPTFMSVDDDGAIHFEWCFGAQGSPESYRLLFMWCPKEGAMMCRTDRGGEQTHDETGTAAMTLRDHLEAEKRDHDAQPASEE